MYDDRGIYDMIDEEVRTKAVIMTTQHSLLVSQNVLLHLGDYFLFLFLYELGWIPFGGESSDE